MPTIPTDQLQKFATALLAAGGATEEESRRVGPSLVDANLKGYESHGVMRIPYYLEATKTGECESGAELTILKESPTHITADANWGFGQVQAGRMMERLTEKARANGMAIGTIIHCGHIGRLGEYCERAAADGLVSMLMVNSHGGAARVAPPGGKAPRLSTNPLAIGVPNGDEPLILDFSTSATAEGKVRVKKIAGETCPEGWLLDSEGRPTTDPNKLYADPPGSILPMGGNQAYKGFGLSLMIEILTGALSGGVVARQPFYPKKGNCVFLMLLDPAAFGGAEHFQTEVANLAEYIRGCPRIDGCERIVLPGDPERFVFAERSKKGIFLDDENWAALCRLAKDLGVTVPGV
jgi:uncharacterized oxidoreductase